ncbi:MAG: ATP-binding protein, partial [Pseudomonadota bacterium]
VATANGIALTDATFSRFSYVTEVDGRRVGRVLVAKVDADGTLWHSSDQGLWRRPAGNGPGTLVTRDDGIHTHEPNQGGMTITDSGQIMITGPRGISVFDPGSAPSTKPPAARLMRYAAGSESHTYRQGEAINLPAGPRSLSLEFGAQALRLNPETRLEYALILDDASELMNALEAQTTLEFPALAAGAYELRARFSRPGSAGDWTTLEITVDPHWWETRLAKTGFWLLAFGAFALLARWRARRVERRYRLIADERQRIAQELHDTFLQDVIAAKMLSRHTDGDDGTGQRIHGLLDSATRSVRASVQALSTLTKMPPLSQTIREYEPPTRANHGITINVAEQGQPWSMGQQRRFFAARITQEAINNACKHSGTDTVEVELDWTALKLTVHVRDRGKGFDESAAGIDEGFGLGAMKRMARSGRMTLHFDSRPGQGTTVTLRVGRLRV